MRILAVADVEDQALGERFDRARWAKKGVELIVSCGDLKPAYLDYLVSVFNVPCFYVRGNHDTSYKEQASLLGGCVNLDGRVETYKGIRFFGLEGSAWYSGGPAQYTEREMWWRAFWAGLSLRQTGGADVFVAHSPPRLCPLPESRCLCLHPPAGTPPNAMGAPCYVDPQRRLWDFDDPPHHGFDVFRRLIIKHQPQVFLHGHTHLGYGRRPRELMLGRTRLIDAYGYVLVDVERTGGR